MLRLLLLLFGSLRAALHSRADLVIENLALRQQLAVLAHTGRRGRVRGRDRMAVLLSAGDGGGGARGPSAHPPHAPTPPTFTPPLPPPPPRPPPHSPHPA